MKKAIVILAVAPTGAHITEFLQHVQDIRYLMLNGSITLDGFKKAFEDKHAGNEVELAAVQDMYDYQLETGTKTDQIVIPSENDDDYVVTYDMMTLEK